MKLARNGKPLGEKMPRTERPCKAAVYFIVLNSTFMSVVTLFYVPLLRLLIAMDCEPFAQQLWERKLITVYSR